MKTLVIGLLILFFVMLATSVSGAIGTTFTYQGRIIDGGLPANGSYELRITPFATTEGGAPLAAPVMTGPINVTDGVFTVQLDFGPAVFLDDPVWLEIEVDGPDTGLVLLTPRQPVTPTPFSMTAGSVAVDGVDSFALQDGSVTAAKVDASQVQLRVTAPCGAGMVLQAVAQNGDPTCVSVGDDDWEYLPDGRLQSVVGVRIQPVEPADFPFSVRHDSSTVSPHIAISESVPNDFSRINFHNDSDFGTFWALAGFIGGAGPEDHLFNVFHSTAGDLLTLRGNQRVGIGNTNPDAPLMVRSQDQWHPDVGNGRGDMHIGTNSLGLSFGVALSGGGAGASRIWAKGGAEQLFLGSATKPDVVSIIGAQVGIAHNSPAATLDVDGGLRIRGLSHGDLNNQILRVEQDGDVVAVTDPAAGTKYISFDKLQFSFAVNNDLNVHIPFPDGVIFDEFTVWYIDNDATWNLSINPLRQDLATGADTGFAGLTSSGASPDIQMETVVLGVQIDNSTTSFRFGAAIALGVYPNIEVIGVRVAYH